MVTAAHAVQPIIDGKLIQAPGGHTVFLKGRGYRVERVVVHPGYDADTNANDIALIKLAGAASNTQPACLYEGRDEAGQITELAGQGLVGTGLTGPGERDGALRGSTVLIDTAEPTVITWLFRPPGDPKAPPLEGISGPGDSGGPAFLRTPAGMCIAGVSSVQRIDRTDAGPGAPDDRTGEGRYGVTEVYTRVSAFAPWIRSTIAAAK